MTDITQRLFRFRRRKIGIDIQSFALISLSALLVTLIILVGLEAIFWFSITLRYGLWQAGMILVLILGIAASLGALLLRRDRIPRYSLPVVAREIGQKGLEKEDEVLNALQLESTATQDAFSSRQLADQFVGQVSTTLDNLKPTQVYGKRAAPRFTKVAGGMTIASLILVAALYPSFRVAAGHWLHPKRAYPVPHPFELESTSGNLYLMGGDDALIRFKTEGKIPHSIEVEIRGPERVSYRTLTRDDSSYFTDSLTRVFQNLRYRGFVKSRHFWEPWDEISSPTYTIHVTDRPVIEDFRVTLSPPAYTGMSPTSQEGNVAEIRGLRGSTIQIQLRSDKALTRAYLKYEPDTDDKNKTNVKMETNRNRAQGEFLLVEDGVFATYIFDERNVGNLDPIPYHFIVVEDIPPVLHVLEPASPTELGSDFTLPSRLHIEDDFGFSNLQIVYEIEHPDYVSSGSGTSSAEESDIVNIHGIDAFSRRKTSQDVFYLWDVSNLNLMPEDELRFHFELYDNDEISGPKKSVSPTLLARFPSMADLFARTVEEEELMEEKAEDMIQDLQDLDDVLKDVELEMLKDEKVSWEQEQTIKHSVEEVREKLQDIQSLRERLQEIVEQSEKHNLFSADLIEKFNDLQELLQSIMTPELAESMEKVREALKNLQPHQLLDELQNFRLNTQELEAQLDRFIDVFRRIRAEQTVDELVVRMENLVKRQETVVGELSRSDTLRNLPRVAEEQERNRREFENIREVMADASRSMETFAPIPAEDLRTMAQSDLTRRTARNLKSASNSLNRGDSAEGLESAAAAKENLENMLGQLREIRETFREQTEDEMVMEFEEILRNTLFISKEQERLQIETRDAPRNSPRLGEMANSQQLLRDQLGQLIESLMTLSHQTFAVTPAMGKAIGRATAGMNESLKKLEDRNSQSAAENQRNTVAALNEAALATLAAIADIRESGMASGFQQFLERMERMAAQQRGINEQSLKLAFGRLAATEREGLMRRLASDQEQLRKSLDQLRREMRGWQKSGSDLRGILDEMEEVLKDFEARKVDRRTVERQERILTRMLDSQKSLRHQDFEQTRKATTARDIVRDGPSGLPEDLGQRRNMAMEALNLALKSGYPKDYQDMIRRYFNALIESPGLIDEETGENR